jgi:hypothetical protein
LIACIASLVVLACFKSEVESLSLQAIKVIIELVISEKINSFFIKIEEIN